MTPFIVYALPRSRTAWCQNWFMSREGLALGHDSGMKSNTLGEFLSLWAGGMNGTFETGMMFGWRAIRHHLPDLRVACIRRPVGEVALSLRKFGIEATDELILRDALLDEIGAQQGVLTIDWNDLDNYHSARAFYEHCTAERFDEARWEQCTAVNVQVDMKMYRELMFSRFAQIAAFKAETIAAVSALPEASRWAGLN